MTFICQAFHEQLPKGKSSAQLEVMEHALVVTVTTDRVHRLELPMEGLAVRMGGASHRLLFFHHGLHPGWEFYTADRRVLSDPHFGQHPSLSGFAWQARLRRWWAFGTAMTLLFGLLLMGLFLATRLDWLTAQVAREVPAEWEVQLGESAMAQFRLSTPFVPEDSFEAPLAELVQPLLQALDQRRYTYEFHVARDSTLNAFALPGGQVVIHSELILQAESAEELLGVVAHEIAHVELQHGLRNVIGAAGLYATATFFLGDATGLLAMLSTAGPYLLNQTYSRKFETEADEVGSQLLEAANIDPSGLMLFFEKIILEEEKQLANIENEQMRDLLKEGFQFFSTHPSSEDRIAALAELIDQIRAEQARGERAYLDLSEPFQVLQKNIADYVVEGETVEGDVIEDEVVEEDEGLDSENQQPSVIEG